MVSEQGPWTEVRRERDGVTGVVPAKRLRAAPLPPPPPPPEEPMPEPELSDDEPDAEAEAEAAGSDAINTTEPRLAERTSPADEATTSMIADEIADAEEAAVRAESAAAAATAM